MAKAIVQLRREIRKEVRDLLQQVLTEVRSQARRDVELEGTRRAWPFRSYGRIR